MHTKTISDLKTAKVLLEKGWIQKCFARDAKDNIVPMRDPTASCWCLVGALPNDHGETIHALRNTLNLDDTKSLVDWNDAPERTQTEVISVIDQTIARLEQEDVETYQATNA